MPDILNSILKIGNPELYQVCESVRKEEITGFSETIGLMRDCIVAFGEEYGQGRAIDEKSFRWREPRNERP